MEKMDKIYPQYGFQKHKGYGTKLHFEMIKSMVPAKFIEKPLNQSREFRT